MGKSMGGVGKGKKRCGDVNKCEGRCGRVYGESVLGCGGR